MKHLKKLKKERIKKMINATPEELFYIFPPIHIKKKKNQLELNLNKKNNNLNDNNINNKINDTDEFDKLFKKGCITCGKLNFWVKYHGESHLCLECRNLLKSKNGNRIVFYLDNNNNPLVFEIIKNKKFVNNKELFNKIINSQLDKEITYKKIKNNEIYYKNKQCVCTLSDINEMIIVPY